MCGVYFGIDCFVFCFIYLQYYFISIRPLHACNIPINEYVSIPQLNSVFHSINFTLGLIYTILQIHKIKAVYTHWRVVFYLLRSHHSVCLGCVFSSGIHCKAYMRVRQMVTTRRVNFLQSRVSITKCHDNNPRSI